MYCIQCGNELKPDDKFCPVCGCAREQPINTPEQQVYIPEQQVYMPVPGNYVQPEKTKKSKKWLWITLASVATVLIAATAVYFVFFRSIGPLLMLGRAMVNLSAEVEERYENSPFTVFENLAEIMEDGTITADFVYTTSILGGWISIDLDGKIEFLSDSEARNFAALAQIGAYGEAIELDFFMNNERMALRLQLLGNDYYGLTYNSFRQDIQVLGRQIGLDNETMELYADFIDQINTAMNTDDTPDDIDEIYTEMITKFARDIKVSSRKSTIETASGKETYTVITVNLTKNALLKLLREMETNDDIMRSQMGIQDNLFSSRDDFIPYENDFERFTSEFNDFVNDFERYYSGNIDILFFIDADERLTRIASDSKVKFEDEDLALKLNLDLGSSVYDEWSLFASYIGPDMSENLNVKWDYKERSGNKINTVTFSTNEIKPITMISDWNPVRNAFSVTLKDEFDSYEFSGVITINEPNFRIVFDDITFAGNDNVLKLEISTKQGAQIREIDYINIDRWGNVVLETIMGLLTEGIFS